MPMYRIHPEKKQMKLFQSSRFSAGYKEADLEDWLEQSPTVVTDGEPLLLISRQRNTPTSGVPDLIGLDQDGNTVVIELKGTRPPRDVIAQALEYAAWLGSQTAEDVATLAEDYLPAGMTLAEAWADAFSGGAEMAEMPPVNVRQRLIIVAEGGDARLEAVARYLRKHMVDIRLVAYRYYRIEGGDEVLDFETVVGAETVAGGGRAGEGGVKSETAVLNQWEPAVVAAYQAFKQRMVQMAQIEVAPKLSVISFYQNTRDGRVFICYFCSGSLGAYVSLRADSLRGYLDANAALEALLGTLPSGVNVRRKSETSIHFVGDVETAVAIAEGILTHIVKVIDS